MLDEQNNDRSRNLAREQFDYLFINDRDRSVLEASGNSTQDLESVVFRCAMMSVDQPADQCVE